MILNINTAPTVEPISLSEIKLFLRLDSTDFDSDISTEQSIAPGAHVVAASYSLVGSGIDVQGYRALVNLNSGTNGASGTVDVKIQESVDDVTYTDWSGGAFTQVTEANDNQVFEDEYTGSLQYIRVVCTVGTATCSFSVDVIKKKATNAEDDLLNSLITAAREHVENVIHRRLISQTWDYYLLEWPGSDRIVLPYPPLQSVTSIAYTDTDSSSTTMTVTTDYVVDAIDKFNPGIVLAYGKSWPGVALTPVNPIKVIYVAGYGDASTNVPDPIIHAMKIMISHWFEHREFISEGHIIPQIPLSADSLLRPYKVERFV